MTLQTITPHIYYGPRVLSTTTATTYTLDASSEYLAWIIQAPKTGTIDRIHWYATTVTADGDGLRQRIETVSATTGDPSGTLVGGSSEITHVTTTANSWNRGTAGLAAAVVKGDIIAVKLMSPAAGTTFNGIIRAKFDGNLNPGLAADTLFPYLVNALPAAAHVAAGTMCLAIEYDDGTCAYIENAMPLSAVTSSSVSSASTPDERGNLFQVPMACRMAGFYTSAYIGGSGGVCDFVLYNAAGSVLETLSVDLDQLRTTATARPTQLLWDTAVTLAANTDYRIVIKPNTGSMTIIRTTIDTAGSNTRIRTAYMGGTSWQQTTRTDAGAWTDTPDTIEPIGLILDQLDDGAGAGSANLLHGKLG